MTDKTTPLAEPTSTADSAAFAITVLSAAVFFYAAMTPSMLPARR